MLEVHVAGYRVESHSPESARYTSRVVLVHGLWTGAWCWAHFGSFLAHRGWEVFAPDLRGRPGSRPARIGDVAFEDYVEDVATILSRIEKPGDAPPVLIGHDVGALVAFAAAAIRDCRAVVALAPPLPGTQTTEYRRQLGRTRGWIHRVVVPPATVDPEESLDRSRLQVDSARIARSLLRDEALAEPTAVPTLLVGGARDPFVSAMKLEHAASRAGCGFAARAAAHWGLAGAGFERQVDVVHRWVVRQVGAPLLRLSGYEDVDEDEEAD
jgi:alpha-beta hydrolase superfamily lysophospholipase